MLRLDICSNHTTGLQGTGDFNKKLLAGLFANIPLNVPYLSFRVEREQPGLVAIRNVERGGLACSLNNYWYYVLDNAAEDQH